MKFNIGDKVVMPLNNGKIGRIVGTDVEYGTEKDLYAISVEGEDFLCYYSENNLLPYIEEKKLPEKILLVEDGSVDIDQLEQDGFYVIVYRNGSQPPMWLK